MNIYEQFEKDFPNADLTFRGKIIEEPITFTGAEDDLQAKCFQWAWNNYPMHRYLLFHVNNKSRNAIEGNQMKAKGVVAGVSDMILVYKGGVAFLEFKTLTGKQRDKQIKFEYAVTSRGHHYVLIRQFEQFKKVFIYYICR